MPELKDRKISKRRVYYKKRTLTNNFGYEYKYYYPDKEEAFHAYCKQKSHTDDNFNETIDITIQFNHNSIILKVMPHMTIFDIKNMITHLYDYYIYKKYSIDRGQAFGTDNTIDNILDVQENTTFFEQLYKYDMDKAINNKAHHVDKYLQQLSYDNKEIDNDVIILDNLCDREKLDRSFKLEFNKNTGE
jgi:hypothetical protein